MSTGGLPLLSGPPPEYTAHESSCRKCDKEFSLLFARSRKCNHCGYAFCHSCTDFQALMPRGGAETGYDVVHVCAFCVDHLTITAGGKGYLRQLPLSRLKKYANAYNLRFGGVLEKDDLIDTIIAARGPDACLPRANEAYYRKNSVPNRRSDRPRGLFNRAMEAMGSDHSFGETPQPQQRPQQPRYQPRTRTTSGPSSFPRPDLDPQQQERRNPNPPHPGRGSTQPPRTPRPAQASPSGVRPAPAHPSQHVPNPSSHSRPRAASATPTPRAPSPVRVPMLNELLEMPEAALTGLSIGALKSVLFQNHVNARLVVEKDELVAKVRTLIEAERRDRARKAAEDEAERIALDAARREREEAEEARRRAATAAAEAQAERTNDDAMEIDGHEQDDDVHMHEDTPGGSPPPPPPPKSTPASPPPASRLSPSAQEMASRLERTGLCVICQDEEANIAIVDCGHLAMCRPCSELIMNSSRECPLCRTRIVTEARLLRIFRT